MRPTSFNYILIVSGAYRGGREVGDMRSFIKKLLPVAWSDILKTLGYPLIRQTYLEFHSDPMRSKTTGAWEGGNYYYD